MLNFSGYIVHIQLFSISLNKVDKFVQILTHEDPINSKKHLLKNTSLGIINQKVNINHGHYPRR